MNASSVRFVERNNKDKRKYKFLNGLDGRGIPLFGENLLNDAKALFAKFNSADFDYILGFAEGGMVPAFALSMAAQRPLIGSYRLRLKLEGEILFQEPHSERYAHYVYGLKPGDRVAIVEDEITSGKTTTNAINALEKAGIIVSGVMVYYLCNEENNIRLSLPSHVPFIWLRQNLLEDVENSG